MNWLDSLLGGDAVDAVVRSLESSGGDVDAREKSVEMLKAQQAFELEAAKLGQKSDEAQTDVDKAEATNPSLFVSGWRPFVGWICAFGLAYVAIVEPLIRFVSKVGFGYKGEFPVIDTTTTGEVLLGMLGLGGMRSFDKLNGTDTKVIGNPGK